MSEVEERFRAARETVGGHAMTSEPEEPESVPMDDASRWASGIEADKRGAIQDAFAVRAITDAGKALISSTAEEPTSYAGPSGDTGDTGDTGEDIPPEWFQWVGEEAGEAVKEALIIGGVATPFARKLWQRTAIGGTPTTPYTEFPRNIGRPTVNPAFPETQRLMTETYKPPGAKPTSTGMARHAAPWTARGAALRAAAAAPAALAAAPAAAGVIGFYNFARGVKKIYDDDPATDMKDHSFKYLQRPLGPRDYLADSREMKYLRANPDAAAALHAAGVLSDSMLDHLATEVE